MRVEVKSVMTNFLLKLVYNLRGGSNPFLRSPKLWYTTQTMQGRRKSSIESEIRSSVLYMPTKAFCTLVLRDTSYKQKSSEKRIVFFWVITQRVVVFFRRSGTTYRPQIYGPRIRIFTPEEEVVKLSRSVSKMYHYLLRNSPEEHSSYLLCVEARNHAHKSATLLDSECANVF